MAVSLGDLLNLREASIRRVEVRAEVVPMEDVLTLRGKLVVTLPSKLINSAIAFFSFRHRLLKVDAFVIYRILDVHIFGGCDL